MAHEEIICINCGYLLIDLSLVEMSKSISLRHYRLSRIDDMIDYLDQNAFKK